MTAGHQRSATDRGSGAAGKLTSLAVVARLDSLSFFFLAVAFRIPARVLPRSLHSGKASIVPPQAQESVVVDVAVVVGVAIAVSHPFGSSRAAPT